MVMLVAFALLVFTNLLTLLMIFVLLVSHSAPRTLRAALVATVLSLLGWQDAIYIADNVTSNLLIWNTLIFLWPTAAVLSCYIFIRTLHSTQTQHRQLSLLTPIIALGTLLQLLPVTTFGIFSYVEVVHGSLLLGRERGYYLYLLGLIISMACLIGEIIIRRRRSARRTLERYAIHVVLITVVIASIYGVITNILIPVISNDQNYIGWGVLIVDIFTIGFALSITRGKLIDIRFYAVRTTVYILSLGTLAFLYAIAAFLLSQWVFGYKASSLQGAINVSLALLLAFIFQPIRQFFDHFTNRIFYRDNYDSDDFYKSLNRLLSTTSDLRGLLERSADFIGTALNASQAFFVVYQKNGYHVSAGTDHHTKLPAKDAVVLDDFFGKSQDNVLVATIMTITESGQTKLTRMLESHRIELVLCLRRNKEIVGYLCLGGQLNGSYTRRDIRILQTVADELVIAIQNALSVQEVRELNDTLQQRINAATRELRASNAQLQRLDEVKDEFISMASHQLRTPLTSVKGYLSMVIEGDLGTVNENQKQLLTEAFLSSERMVRLIGDFLNVSRLQTGKFEVEKHPTDLADIVRQEIEVLKPSAMPRAITFDYKQPHHFPLLNIDENKIRQVIMNFSDNAIYYSKEKSTIIISLKLEGSDVVFTVKDTGIGVPVNERANLFNKFYRATNARKARPDGTGVGLFLAKKVIDAHRGTVIFETEEGKGSTFGFRLPLALVAVEQPDVSKHAATVTRE